MRSITCSSCGIRWDVPDQYQDDRRQDHATFYCPNGHSQWYPGKTAQEKKIAELEKQLAKNREFQRERFHDLLEQREEWKDLALRCPICREKVAKRLTVHENIMRRLDEHLRSEHGAVDRRRMITAA